MQAGWLHNNSVASNTLMRFAKVTCSVHLHWQLNADAAALRRELQVIQVGALFHFFFSLFRNYGGATFLIHLDGLVLFVYFIQIIQSLFLYAREFSSSQANEKKMERELQILVLLTFYQLFVAAMNRAHVGESREFLPQSSLSCHPQQQQQSREDEE